MEIPANAVTLVKRWEGLHKKGRDGLVYPYLCPAMVWTIGYGSTRETDGRPITKDTRPKTESECEDLMMIELRRCHTAALRNSPILVNHEEALGAICSFIFNLGAGAYQRSTLRRRINEEDWEEAQREIKKWVWAGGKRLNGLVARRNEESRFLKPREEVTQRETSEGEYFPSWLRFWELSSAKD